MNHKEIGFNLTEEELSSLLNNGLKPEEIGGDAVIQLERVNELIHWFVRYAEGDANPKWAIRHAFELAYYIASTSGNRFLDLKEIKMKAWREGVNITSAERSMLEKGSITL